MRGLDTPVRKVRRKVFTEIARLGFANRPETLISDIEEIPYKIVQEKAIYRESIYRERAVVNERVRLAMGMSLRPENRAVHVTSGIEASNIDEKYYEPPLLQVIPSGCDACEPKTYEVSNMCRGCMAHPCTSVCPKNAVSMKNGRSYIDQEKCIKCGKCKAVCPYDAIAKKERPCARACGVNAIESDSLGRAAINSEKCVSCGMCMVSCPFGAIADKSQIYQLAKALAEGKEIIAEVAPAFVGQFGETVTAAQLKTGLLQMGFSDLYEVALGADIGCVTEAHHYANHVVTGELPFLLTSCCPSWTKLARKYFPDMIQHISQELTPMVATARSIKQEHLEAKVVFIGPCASKKLEASRTEIRSDVDFVITFEELEGMLEAKEIKLENLPETPLHDSATAAGRGYAVAGGVTDAIRSCLKAYYPEVTPRIEHAEGLAECRKILAVAKSGKLNGCLIEGMACPGGCMGGAGTNASWKEGSAQLKKFVKETGEKVPARELEEIQLP